LAINWVSFHFKSISFNLLNAAKWLQDLVM